MPINNGPTIPSPCQQQTSLEGPCRPPITMIDWPEPLSNPQCRNLCEFLGQAQHKFKQHQRAKRGWWQGSSRARTPEGDAHARERYR